MESLLLLSQPIGRLLFWLAPPSGFGISTGQSANVRFSCRDMSLVIVLDGLLHHSVPLLFLGKGAAISFGNKSADGLRFRHFVGENFSS
jgi:hypothetical protein